MAASDENDFHDDDDLLALGSDGAQVHRYVGMATREQRKPTEEELRELQRKLACFVTDHDTDTCGGEHCCRNATYLQAQGFLFPGKTEIGHLCFTPDLVGAAAWGSLHAIPELDLPYLQQLITRYAEPADAGRFKVDQF